MRNNLFKIGLFLVLLVSLSFGGEARAAVDSCVDKCIVTKSIAKSDDKVKTKCDALSGLTSKKDISCKIDDTLKKIKNKNLNTVSQCLTSCIYLEDKKDNGLFSNCKVGSGETTCKMSVTDSTKPGDPGHDTKNFFLQFGTVKLSPYSIILDQSTGVDGSTYILENSDDASTTSFVEGVYRSRMAWERDNRYQPDIEFKAALYDNNNAKTAGAVVSGSSDMAFELSIGLPVCLGAWLCSGANEKVNRISHTINFEVMYGLTTDKNFQTVHDSKYGGVVGVIAIPTKTGKNDIHDRNFELLLGLYKGEIDLPKFANSDTKEILMQHGTTPVFERTEVVAFRASFHMPYKKHGFLVFGMRAHRYPHSEYRSTPWTVSLGITIPFMDIFSALADSATDIEQ